MSLTLYFHPLASYCWKVLIALYESELTFTGSSVNLADAAERAQLQQLWPPAKFPVLQDERTARVIPESTIIIEYLAQTYPGRVPLVPKEPELALETRFKDRFFDLYVHEPMQKIVFDRLRPAERRDPEAVAQAKAALELAYGMIDRDMQTRSWANGSDFSMADCAAAPALYYANRVAPFGSHAVTAAYLERLQQRPSFRRVLQEAEPYFHNFPSE